MQQLDFKALETFLWIVRLGSFRAAAQRLNTTQPSVSARIATLEQALGVALFDRAGRGIRLTGKGRELREHAERLINMRNELLAEVADPTTVQGTIRLGVAETIVHTWLPTLVERLSLAFPSVSLELEVDTSGNLRDSLVTHALDVAFLLGPVSQPEIVNEPLCDYALTWIGSPRLPLAAEGARLSDLARFPIITYPRMTRPHVALADMFRSVEPAPRIHSSSSLATIVRMVTQGIGISAIPLEIVRAELERGEIVPLNPHPEARLPDLQFTASFPINPDSALSRAVVDLAVEVARGR